MPIKVGFSTTVCPRWSLEEIAQKAGALGYYGVELAPHPGQPHLPLAAEFSTDEKVAAARSLFATQGVELVGLVSSHTLESKRPAELETALQRNIENIALAAGLGCGYVRIPLGRPTGSESVNLTLARVTRTLAELAPVAARHGVTLLAANTAHIPDSRALWVVADGVAQPSVACAWNPVLGLSAGDTCSIAVPRLGARLRMVQAVDASFGPHQAFQGYRPVGQGSVDWDLTIDWLRGVLFDGYLMVDGPPPSAAGATDLEGILGQALAYLLERIKRTDSVLTAYKGDKNAPNYKTATKAFTERSPAGSAAACGG